MTAGMQLAKRNIGAELEPLQPAPRDPKRPLVIASLLIVSVFGGLGLWAALAPIDSAVVAPGVVTVESNRRTVQHLEGGIIAEIQVREGTGVQAGDVLMRLDDTRTRAQEEVLRSDLDAAMATEARLIAERDQRQRLIFPDTLELRRGERKVAEILDLQLSQFLTRNAALDGQRAILQQRIQQLEEEIAGLRGLELSKQRQIQLIGEEMRSIADLVREGHVTRSRYLALQRESSRLEGERDDHKAKIAKARQGIGEAKLQILQLENERQQEISTQLREVQGKIFETAERLRTAEDQRRRNVITAPVSGTVINLAYVTPGGVIAPGAAILSLVPQNDKMVVEVQIPPAEIDSVRIGQSVAIRIASASAKQLPVLSGTLESISADRLTADQKPETRGTPVVPLTTPSFYAGRIAIARDELAKLGDLSLHAGMPVEVMINRGERTVAEYVLAPLTSNFNRAFKER